jgi:hypothetical protein
MSVTVVTAIIKKIEAHFGKMTVTRGKHHVFLGMDITFNDDATVTINMESYVKEAITDSGMSVSRKAVTPAKNNLFSVDPLSVRLGTKRSDLFHSVVAKLLYVSKRARPDISMTIAFLTTRVSCSTEQDWEKLQRLIEYLNSTLDLPPFVLGADSLNAMKTWVDASYAVHDDMKSHTGGVASLGRGGFMGKSNKHSINTKSSTEAETVAASDYMPNTIWAKNFMGAQGHVITENIFYQDNQSAIRLERNGRASCGQKSRHIDIRYFFMKDRIVSEGISIVYCPTGSMAGDFLTKPLQGALFRKFRSALLGHTHMSSLSPSATTSTEERVENSVVEETQLEVDGQTVMSNKDGGKKHTYAEMVRKDLRASGGK